MAVGEFFQKLAMISLEKDHPKAVKRLDELTDKEKQKTITDTERTELEDLDSALFGKFLPLKLHYEVNWLSMSSQRKAELKQSVRERFAEAKGPKVKK